jgi:hypothetical protein
MAHQDIVLTSRGGPERRVIDDTANLLEAGCGVALSRADPTQAVGVNRSNRDQQLGKIERRW